MENNREPEAEERVEMDAVQALRARIATRIREDSEVRGEVTSVTAIAPFFAGMTADDVEAGMAGLAE
ncbi:MAG TPA: hypothetical protein VLC95_02065, partial [Anaerolineae bacterium]|nr:hypothetical protein [Anaerolineae bacterium]